MVLPLTNNKFSIPSFAILDENFQSIETIPFFQTPENITHILEYFGEDIYKKMSWDEYVKSQTNNNNNSQKSSPKSSSTSSKKKSK